MPGTCIKCGRRTHGKRNVCYDCADDTEHYDKDAQSSQRREFQSPYAEAQTGRLNAIAIRVEAEEAAMKAKGLDPRKH